MLDSLSLSSATGINGRGVIRIVLIIAIISRIMVTAVATIMIRAKDFWYIGKGPASPCGTWGHRDGEGK